MAHLAHRMVSQIMSADNPPPASNLRIFFDVLIGLLCAGTAAVIAGLVFTMRGLLGRRSRPPRVTCAR